MTIPVSPRLLPTADLADRLQSLEHTLDEQLDSLPKASDDIVAAAHRAGVERNLEEVRLALRLHGEGRYGTCVGCADPISVVRLNVRPWATRCVRCKDRFGW